MEGVCPFKKLCTLHHDVYIKSFRKSNQQRCREGMRFSSEGKQVEVFLHFWMLNDIKTGIHLLYTQRPDIRWQVLVEIYQEVGRIFQWLMICKKLKSSFLCRDFSICAAGSKDLELEISQNEFQSFFDEAFHRF